MKFVLLTLTTLTSIALISGKARADQAATLTCTGPNIVIAVKSPYLGENSKATQQLYVLKLKLDNYNETSNTAYFLDVEPDIGGRTTGGAGMLVFTGKNEVGGTFQMIIHPWKDTGSTTVIRDVSNGKITYSHGPLSGKDEAVDCIRE